MRGREEQRHLGRVAVRDQRCTLGPCRVHDRADVIHPVLRSDGGSSAPIREADATHVEPENAGEPRQPRHELLHERLLPHHLEMARPVEDQNDVAGTVAITW